MHGPVIALVLDHEVRTPAEDRRLADIVALLVSRGVLHVAVIGAGEARPEEWTNRYRFVGERHGSPRGEVVHFAGVRANLALIPAGSGRTIVARALRELALSASPVSIETLDAAVRHLAGPAPDLVIVTGARTQLGGALTWGAAYAELLFLEPAWDEVPDAVLEDALAELGARNRRFGGLQTASR